MQVNCTWEHKCLDEPAYMDMNEMYKYYIDKT